MEKIEDFDLQKEIEHVVTWEQKDKANGFDLHYLHDLHVRVKAQLEKKFYIVTWDEDNMIPGDKWPHDLTDDEFKAIAIKQERGPYRTDELCKNWNTGDLPFNIDHQIRFI